MTCVQTAQSQNSYFFELCVGSHDENVLTDFIARYKAQTGVDIGFHEAKNMLSTE